MRLRVNLCLRLLFALNSPRFPAPCQIHPRSHCILFQVYPTSFRILLFAKALLNTPSDLKNTLDDHLPVYLSTATTLSGAPLPREQRFTPSHFKNYVRLGLGYSSVAVAAYIFYLDYYLKKDFKDTKQVTLYAVVGYFILNTALTLWMWFGERGLVFAGSRSEKSGKPKRSGGGQGSAREVSLEIFSYAPSRKFSPVYRIAASWRVTGDAGADKGQSTSIDLTAPFTQFFASDGYFVPKEFEAWLRKEIPVVAKSADQTGKVEEISAQDAELFQQHLSQIGDGNATAGGTSSVLKSQRGDAIVLGGGSSSADAGTPSPKKRGRPRKD